MQTVPSTKKKSTSKTNGKVTAATIPAGVRAVFDHWDRDPLRREQYLTHTRALVLEHRLREAKDTLADLKAPAERVRDAIALVERFEAAALPIPPERGNSRVLRIADALAWAARTPVIGAIDRGVIARNIYLSWYPSDRERLADDTMRAAVDAWIRSTREIDRAAAVRGVLVALGEAISIGTIERALRRENTEKKARGQSPRR